jgi:hypothetical protein
MKIFARANAGRIDELVTKLQQLSVEWNKPTTAERLKGYFKGVRDLTITAVAKAAVEATMKLR